MTFDANSPLAGPANVSVSSKDGYHVVVQPEGYSVVVNTVGLQGEPGVPGPVGPQGPQGLTGPPGGSPNYLKFLLDVDLTSLNPEKEYALKYDPNLNKWVQNDVYNGGNF